MTVLYCYHLQSKEDNFDHVYNMVEQLRARGIDAYAVLVSDLVFWRDRYAEIRIDD